LVPRKAIVWTALTVAALVVGLIMVLIGFTRFKQFAAEWKQQHVGSGGGGSNSPTHAAPNTGNR
jgi:hypothetical protein